MNKVYLVITEYDWFYDSHDMDIEIFDTLESAKQFLELQGDIILDKRKEEYIDSGIMTKSEVIENYVKIIKRNGYINIFAEDEYEIDIYIKEKDVMSI
jgi:hypothetical protein